MTSEIDWTEKLGLVHVDSQGGVVVDDGFRIRAISDGVLRRTGMSRNAALEKSALDIFHPTDIGRAAAVIGRAIPGEVTAGPGIYRVVASSRTWDIYEMQVVGLGEVSEGAVLLEFVPAGSDARAGSLIDDAVELTTLLVQPQEIRHCFREIADFAERNVDRLSLSITVFAEDGSAATFCQRDLDEVTSAMNAAAHPLSLPQHVVEAYSKAKLRNWRAESEVGTILPDRPDRMTMVLLDLEDNLLGYVDGFRASTVVPKEDEWRVYRLVSQMLRAVMLNAQLGVRLDYLSQNDALTGLRNRYFLLDKMSHVDLAGSGVLAIDLDGFAWVNQSLGFSAGDTVLSSVAASISSFVPSSAVAARLSGDEFLVWLPKATSAEEVSQLAEELRKVIMVPIDNADRRGRTRCSVGATQALPGETADAVIQRAVAAMSHAKSAGGDRVTRR